MIPWTFRKQDSWNFLEEDLTTHIGGAGPIEVALAFKFATVTRNIQQVLITNAMSFVFVAESDLFLFVQLGRRL